MIHGGFSNTRKGSKMYGSISDEMRSWIEKRAKEGNVFERFELEPSLCESPENCEQAESCICFVPGILTVTVIVEGALDEEFHIRSGGFEVNIADWIAEKLELEGITNFWVLVSDGEGNTLYSTETGF